MTTVTFIEPGGDRIDVEAIEGWTVMQTALNQGIDGVVAECGGALACATCHCYVESDVLLLPPPSADEREMLEGVAAPRLPNSRLSCQITITAGLTGLTIRYPDIQ